MDHISHTEMAAAGVKGLVDAGVRVVPDEYIRKPKEPDPIEYDEAVELPVVDLSGIEDDESKRALVVDAVHKACQEWGFFQVTGHGIPLELMQSMNELVHYFFNMPAEERMVYYTLERTKSFRFGTSFNPGVEKTKLWVDFLFQQCPPKYEEMPDNIPGYREIATDYSKQVYSLAMRLLGLLNECLGLKPGTLKHMVEASQIRMNYYPPCPNPDAAVGLEMHSDIDTFTILQQENGVEGLQVLHKGRWVTVKPLLGAFVVNIGDQMQILTNGKYKSAEHRASLNSSKTRVSIASFHFPAPDAYISPMSELLGDLDAPLYKGCKYGDYSIRFFSKGLYGKSVLDTLKI